MLEQQVSRFIYDNTTGSEQPDVITDTMTDLMWVRNAGLFEPKTWLDSINLINKFNQNGGLYGYNDWRLPDIAELMSIIINMLPNVVHNLNVEGFDNIVEGFYWSASTYDNFDFLSLGVHMKCGSIDARNKFNDSVGYIWPIRGETCST